MEPLAFCGRGEELAALIERWRLASDLSYPQAQLVTIKAERGVGKTRLALEFYRWLSANADLPGEGGYWPDRTAVSGANLDVNPDLASCDFSVPIPFLWWGLRSGDPGAENGVTGDAIATYDRALAPHLVPLMMRARMKRRGMELAEVWADVGVDIVTSVLQIDSLLSIGRGLFDTARILAAGRADQAAPAAAAEASGRPLSRADAVLADLEKIFNPKSFTYARTPGVIFIDDAQFARHDPALPGFIERLLQLAVAQSWPLMILATHWRRELAMDAREVRASYAGIVSAGLSPNDPAFATAGVARYLDPANYREIDLTPVGDLSPAIAVRLPGLAPAQSAALLDRAGGNPRFLEQILAWLLINEHLFENFDTTAALTEEGLNEALEESQDIAKVVLRRLAQAPLEVQEAVCLASVQGVRFATSLADQMAEDRLRRPVWQDLAAAEDPFSMVVGTRSGANAIGEFSERLFLEAAATRRRSLKSLGGEQALTAWLKEALKARLLSDTFALQAPLEDCLLTCALAENVFLGGSGDERFLALGAMAWLASSEQQRFAFESALAVATRFAAAKEGIPGWETVLSPLAYQTCATILQDGGLIAEAESIIHPVAARLRSVAERSADPEALRNLSVFLGLGADAALAAGEHGRAAAGHSESVEIASRLAQQLGTPEALRDLSVSLNQAGAAALARGDLEGAATARVRNLEICRSLAQQLRTPEALEDLSIALDLAGDEARELGDHPAAATAYQECLEIRRRLREQQETPRALHALALSLNKLADLAHIRGDYANAAAAAQESMLASRDLVEQLRTPDTLRTLAGTLLIVGDAARFAGDIAAATAAYDESVRVRRGLVHRLGTPEALNDLATSLNCAGDAATIRGDFDAAEAAFGESVAITEALAERLQTPAAVRAWFLALGGLGDVALKREDFQTAAALLDKTLALARELAGRVATTAARRDLCVALRQRGDCAFYSGDDVTALAAYRECLEYSRELVALGPTPEAKRDLWVTIHKMALVETEAKELRSAVEHLEEGEALVATLDFTREEAGDAFARLRLQLEEVLQAASRAGPDQA